ncbi:MAG: ABC transporter permease [Planctomycetota bacterium]|jgi:ABC-type dipeptide/oligopeptide/nickel transport system permease subunit|nr:ABC transporter permease [Planctomycetota bacterium]
MKTWLLILALYLLGALATVFGFFHLEIDTAREHADLAPQASHWFGTDHLGRDIFSWTIQGGRVALVVGCLAAGVALLLGTSAGLLAGWHGGKVDAFLLWLSGSVAAIPGILLVLVISWMLGGGYVGVFLAVGMVSWVGIYRMVRTEVQRLRSAPFVLAAQLQGASTSHLMGRHLLPNMLPLLTTQFLLHFIFAVKAEAILSFLGVGMHDTPSWGRLIADAWEFDDLGTGRWWRLTAATLAMAGLVLALQQLMSRLQKTKA